MTRYRVDLILTVEAESPDNAALLARAAMLRKDVEVSFQVRLAEEADDWDGTPLLKGDVGQADSKEAE